MRPLFLMFITILVLILPSCGVLEWAFGAGDPDTATGDTPAGAVMSQWPLGLLAAEAVRQFVTTWHSNRKPSRAQPQLDDLAAEIDALKKG